MNVLISTPRDSNACAGLTTITEEGGPWQEKKKQIKKKAKPPSWRSCRTWQGSQAKIRGVRKDGAFAVHLCEAKYNRARDRVCSRILISGTETEVWQNQVEG